MCEVFVYVYDITKGLASKLSQTLLGKYVPGIWHTGIVVYGQEIFFGSNGIEYCLPTGTVLGQPNEKLKLGITEKAKEELHIHLINLSNNIFHGSKYDLLNHNCNTFSNELSLWLTGLGIPKYITELPHEIMSTPFGQMLRPLIDQYSPGVSAAYNTATTNDSLSNNISTLSTVYYKESLGSQVDAFLAGEISISQLCYENILKSMIYSIKEQTSSYISEEIVDLLILTGSKDSMDIKEKMVVFDVLRLFILRNIESVVILFVDPLVWMLAIQQESTNEDLNDFICKFLCNLIGAHFETICTNKDILRLINDFGLKCLQSKSTMEVASALIRNLIINKLDEDIMLEISSSLMYIMTNDEIDKNENTNENVIGSVYFLVKNSKLIKDLAKAQDIDKRIKRETKYCQLLHNELQ